MTELKMTCDGCGKPLEPKGDRYELKPLRGGIAFYERVADHRGGDTLTTAMMSDFALHFCPDTNGACVGDYFMKLMAAQKEGDAQKALKK